MQVHGNKHALLCIESTPARQHRDSRCVHGRLDGYESIFDLQDDSARTVIHPHQSDGRQIRDNPVGFGSQNLLGRVAGDEAEDLAAGVLARPDPSGAVLEHQNLLLGAGQRETVAAETVASRIRLAVLD